MIRLVVDSNILFTFFWKNSVFYELCNSNLLEIYSPEYSLEEIKKYSSEIIRKTKITKKEFNSLRNELIAKVNFIPVVDYSFHFGKIKALIKELPEIERLNLMKDIDFLALSLKLNIPLWSNDKLLKKQQAVEVLTTEEVIKIMF